MEEKIECRIIEGGVAHDSWFQRNILMDLDDILDFRTKYNNKGIFTTAYKYSEILQEKALLLGDLYFDFDVELENDDDFDKIKRDVEMCIAYICNTFGIEEQQIDLFFSGNKGVHLILKHQYLGIEPHDNLNQIFRAIAEDIYNILPHKTMDMKVYDRRRLWRMANSIHNKSGLYKIPIELRELRELSLSDITELAKNQRFLLKKDPVLVNKANMIFKSKSGRIGEKPVFKKRKTNIEIKVIPPCINELINGNVQKGQRNNTAIALASFFHQQGASKEDCLSKLEEWNNKKCEELLPQREIDMVIDHVYETGYSYGCSGLRVLATCNKRKCPLVK